MRRSAFFVLAVEFLSLAHGQTYPAFSDLAVTDQGELYFTSSLVLRSPKPPLAGNAFRYTHAGQFEWFAPPWGPVNGTIGLSGDGSVISSTESNTRLECGFAMSHCRVVVTARTSIVSFGLGRIEIPAWVDLSHNGRYALSHFERSNLALIDLASGASRRIEGTATATRQVVTDDGGVLVKDGNDLVLRRQSGDIRFTPVELWQSAKIDPAGNRIVYCDVEDAVQKAGNLRWSLRVIDVAARRDSLMAEGEIELPDGWIPGEALDLSLSSDGGVVAYRLERRALSLNWQVFVARTDGSGPRQLTANPEGIYNAVLRADGKVVYAISGSSQIIRIDTASGETSEILPRTPVAEALPSLVPGSSYTLNGRGLSDATAYATGTAPTTLAGVRVALGNRDVPIVTVSPRSVRFQVPFETPLGGTILTLPNDSPFEAPPSARMVAVVARNIQFLDIATSGGRALRAVHEDFGSLVSWEHPALPNEIIHLYAIGLGPVGPAVATGYPAPSDPPAVVTEPVECRFWDAEFGFAAIPVRFAGLAPGLYGIYQVSVQLPGVFRNKPQRQSVLIGCGIGGGPGDVAGIVVTAEEP